MMSGIEQEIKMKESAKQTQSDVNYPPSMQEIKIYFNQKGMPDCEADNFYRFYEKKRWTGKNGYFYKNWKQIAYRWIADVVKAHPFLFDRRIH